MKFAYCPMAGMYIHIPFCKKVCSYCDFYKSTFIHLIPDYLVALAKELEIRKNYLHHERVETIYFGGGTPSLLSPLQIRKILDHISSLYNINDACEITIEGNPDDLDSGFLNELARVTSVNRLSIGIQSFNDEDLRLLNRRHNAHQSITCIQNVRSAGFNNISIDLIYGIPGMTNERWMNNLDLARGIEHISAYHLSIEPGTALAGEISRGTLMVTGEEESTRQFSSLVKFAREHDYLHYEISNLAKKGYLSGHNSNYWLQKKYIGLGPSAHSYDLNSRQWNTANVKRYIEVMNTDGPYYDREVLSVTDRFNEYLMVSLRTMWGVDLKKICSEFGEDWGNYLTQAIQSFSDTGHIIRNGEKYRMTESGWLISDYIIRALLKQ